MHWTVPRLRAGLRMLAASREPSALPAPTRVWISSTKRMTDPSSATSLRMPLSRSSNWPRYLVPAMTRERSRARIRLVGEGVGHLPGGDALGEALDEGRLAHAGLAEEDGVVLVAAGQDLDHALELLVAPHEGVEGALRGQGREVLRELVQAGLGLLRRFSKAWRLRARTTRSRAVGRVTAVLGQEPPGRRVLQMEEPRKRCSGPTRSGGEPLGLLGSVLLEQEPHVAGPGRRGARGGRRRVPGA